MKARTLVVLTITAKIILILSVIGSCSDNAASMNYEALSLEQREEILVDHLHQDESGIEAMQLFPDLEEVYVDHATYANLPDEILPFTYYYSSEADLTVSICEIDNTVFICPGLIDFELRLENADQYGCTVNELYTGQKRS